MKSQILLFVLLAFFKDSFGGNILFISGVPSPSHHIYNRALVVGLAAKGHNVTFISADLSKVKTPNVHYILLEQVYEKLYEVVEGEAAFDLLEYAELSPNQALMALVSYFGKVCKAVLNAKGLDAILNYPDNFKFDAIVNDITFGQCLLPLVAKFNYPPVIQVSAFANPPYTTDYAGGHKYPAYVPHYNLNYPVYMNFFQRLHNTGFYLIDWLSREYFVLPAAERLVRQRFNFDFLPLKKLAQKTALILVNTDDAIDNSEPIPPNMIQVGGLQIVDPKPLPKEMEDFIKSGKKGTVLMSLGTNMKSNMLGEERLKVIIETFAQLPEYNFLWKFEDEAKDLPAVISKNVMLGKFLPQNDILAQPNLIAFITHSGMLSTHEAFWHGKPVIAMPFFVDQHMNSAKAVNLGVGVKIDFKTLTVQSFKSSIETIVKDPKYSKNSLKVSKLFRDKPQRPLDRAIWWIEYVLRNPNVDNLVSPTIKLGPFISNSYDIILTVLVFIFLILHVTRKIIKKIKNLCFKKVGKSKSD